MKRRTLLQILTAGAAWRRLSVAVRAQTGRLSEADISRLNSIAEVVLPSELGAGRDAVVDDFLRWIANYRESAEMDHGYGFTRLRRTPRSPALKYPAQLALLERAAQARGSSFEKLDVAARRQIVEQALAAAKIDRLPAQPSGDHVAADLMAFYFQSSTANDLAYQARIGRDDCRRLGGSDRRPTGVRTGSDPGPTPLRPQSDPGPTPLRPRSDPGLTP